MGGAPGIAERQGEGKGQVGVSCAGDGRGEGREDLNAVVWLELVLIPSAKSAWLFGLIQSWSCCHAVSLKQSRVAMRRDVPLRDIA